MRPLVVTALLTPLAFAACGRKETPPEETLDPSKEVAADKSGHVDPGVKEDLEKLTWLDDAAGEGESSELESATSVAGKTVVVELTPEQLRELEQQREENRRFGRSEVTVKFTPAQRDAIRRVCPACEERSITWHSDRVGVRVKLRFDEAGRIVTPPAPFPYVSR